MVVGTNSLSPLKRLTQNYFSHTVHNFEFSPGNGHKTNYKFGQFQFVSSKVILRRFFFFQFFAPSKCIKLKINFLLVKALEL